MREAKASFRADSKAAARLRLARAMGLVAEPDDVSCRWLVVGAFV